jgi:septal ring factor EnvC (AmiA/AmiB activator)
MVLEDKTKELERQLESKQEEITKLKGEVGRREEFSRRLRKSLDKARRSRNNLPQFPLHTFSPK